jgi:hypothetical protein
VLYVLFYAISVVLYEFGFDVTRNLILKKLHMYDSIAEYQWAIETGLQMGRMFIFAVMVVFGFFTAGLSAESLQLAVRIFCAAAILIMTLMNILFALYERKFNKNIMSKE